MADERLKNYWFKMRQSLLAGVAFFSSVTFSQAQVSEKDINGRSVRIEKTSNSKSDKFQVAPKCVIDFQNDTVYNSVLGGFSPLLKTTTMFIREDNVLPRSLSKSVKVHEHKHHRNDLNGLLELNMSLEEIYKICCLDEISANIEGLLELRQQYIEASSEQQRLEIIKDAKSRMPEFNFYFDAVQNKKINPFTLNPEEFTKEMQFIGQEVQKKWMKDIVESYDRKQLLDLVYDYFSTHDYDELESNPSNYQKARKIALGNIGGIDFTKYLDDIVCYNPHIKEADKLLAANHPRSEVGKYFLRAGIDISMDVTLSQYEQLYYLRMMSEELRKAVNDIKIIKSHWNNCRDENEKWNIEEPTSVVASDWLFQVKCSEIEPQKEGLSAQEIQYLQSRCCYWYPSWYPLLHYSQMDISQIRTYYDFQGDEHLREIVRNGEADKNFEAKIKEYFTIDGIDFSIKDISLYSPNPYIHELDQKIQNSKDIDIYDFCEFDVSSDIKFPEIHFNDALSPQEQFQIAWHQMFIENVLLHESHSLSQLQELQTIMQCNRNSYEYSLRNNLDSRFAFYDLFDFEKDDKVDIPYKSEEYVPDFDYFKKTESDMVQNASVLPFFSTIPAEQINSLFGEFRKKLDDNPELCVAWKLQEERLIRELQEHYKTKLFISTGNQEAYRQALRRVYTVDNFDLTPLFHAETLFSENVSSSHHITDISFWARLKNNVTQKWDTFNNWLTNKLHQFGEITQNVLSSQSTSDDYRKKVYEPDYHHERESLAVEDRYDTEWLPYHRVSPVLYEEIHDFSKPFLKEHYEKLVARSSKISLLNQRKENVHNLQLAKKDIKQRQDTKYAVSASVAKSSKSLHHNAEKNSLSEQR